MLSCNGLLRFCNMLSRPQTFLAIFASSFLSSKSTALNSLIIIINHRPQGQNTTHKFCISNRKCMTTWLTKNMLDNDKTLHITNYKGFSRLQYCWVGWEAFCADVQLYAHWTNDYKWYLLDELLLTTLLHLCTCWKHFPQSVQSGNISHIDTVFAEVLLRQVLGLEMPAT